MNSGFIKEKSHQNNSLTVKLKSRTVESESEPVVIDLSKDKIVSDFLEAQTKHTKATYTTYFKRVLEFTNQNGQQILDESEEWIHKIFDFQNFLKSKGYSSNYIQSNLGCLRGFFAYYRKSIPFNRSEKKKINSRSRTTTDYRFSREEISHMGQIASIKERFCLYVGKSVGLRSEDFVKITYGMLRRLDLDEDAPIFLGEIPTEKESVKAYCFLDVDAIGVCKTLLQANTDKSDDARIFSSRKQELSVLLRALAKKSGIDSHGSKIRFHCLRKFLIDRLSAYSSESQWKQIIGKSISEGAYVSTEQLKGIYERAMKDISVTSNGSKNTKVEELENALIAVEKENMALKTRIEVLQKRFGLTEEAFSELVKPDLKQKLLMKQTQAGGKGLSLIEIEMPKTPREIIEAYLRLTK